MRGARAGARATSLQLEESQVPMEVDEQPRVNIAPARAPRAGRLGVGRAPLSRAAPAAAASTAAASPSPSKPAPRSNAANDATQLPLRSEASFDSDAAKADSQPPGNAESTPPDDPQMSPLPSTQPRVQFALLESPDMPLHDSMPSPPPPQSLFDGAKSSSTSRTASTQRGAGLTTTFTTNVTSPTSSPMLPPNPKAVMKPADMSAIPTRAQRDAAAADFRATLIAQKREQRARAGAAASSSAVVDDPRGGKAVFGWAETQDVTDPSISVAATRREEAQSHDDEAEEYQIGAKGKAKEKRSIVKPAVPAKVREQEGWKQRLLPKGAPPKAVSPGSALAQRNKRAEAERKNTAGPSTSKRQRTRSPSPATQPPLVGSPEAESQTESESDEPVPPPLAVPWSKGGPLGTGKAVGDASKRNQTDPGPKSAAQEQTQSSCTQESVTEDASSVTEDADSQPLTFTSPPRPPPAPVVPAKRKKLSEALSPPSERPSMRAKPPPVRLSKGDEKQAESSRIAPIRRPAPLRAAEKAKTVDGSSERAGSSGSNSTGNASTSRVAMLAAPPKKSKAAPSRTASAPYLLSGTAAPKTTQDKMSLARGSQSSSAQAPP